MAIKLEGLTTEERNPSSKQIDTVSTQEMLRIINEEDKKVPEAVEKEIEHIAKAVEIIVGALRQGGRLVYLGAGTSGRLGVLDAVECRPTYGVTDEVVQGIMAGGNEAMFKAREGAEDSKELAIEDLKDIGFNSQDVLVGIAASGRTPYVIGGLEYGNQIGASTIAVACNKDSEMARVAHMAIEPVVGPEVITGSTRMKAGTAQKLVLNMLSTGAMIQLGKVYSNLMVDVRASNEKLVERAKSIVIQATGCTREQATRVLEATQYEVKQAIVMLKTGLEVEKVKALLDEHHGQMSIAIKSYEEVRKKEA
ncbi:N-acetylmuramic acid 6-phosphate etherase [Niameybacter massiliensis]|uniref:N-acetylmuramic acid 6-phosphate etherase n=1 Tax=Holtiella tumoricola TaxID=3018743 RepID=A0AA42DLN5_9FIRM|nr:N-acetylmuramic acid 6-phosphate etherase [Holtiella tumoricola]MDA3731324.1 N-acetylmuramic acid 6-phosphate etherase [Holtiella tumoricola]